MDGSNRLHTDAATITPAAKPSNARCTVQLISFFRNKTHAAPSDVPNKGIIRPQKTKFVIMSLISLFLTAYAVSYYDGTDKSVKTLPTEKGENLSFAQHIFLTGLHIYGKMGICTSMTERIM